MGPDLYQIGKLSGGDFIVDTENKYGMRYSVLVPYAKKSKLTIDRVRVAIPEELGKLILLYKYLVGIGDTGPDVFHHSIFNEDGGKRH